MSDEQQSESARFMLEEYRNIAATHTSCATTPHNSSTSSSS